MIIEFTRFCAWLFGGWYLLVSLSSWVDQVRETPLHRFQIAAGLQPPWKPILPNLAKAVVCGAWLWISWGSA